MNTCLETNELFDSFQIVGSQTGFQVTIAHGLNRMRFSVILRLEKPMIKEDLVLEEFSFRDSNVRNFQVRNHYTLWPISQGVQS